MGILHTAKQITFTRLERLGLHITKNHFYEPVPDVGRIPDDYWQRKSEMVGINMNGKCQIELLSVFLRYADCWPLPDRRSRSFGPVDTEILYSMVRYFRPQRVIEIGSGTSTEITLLALRKNGCGEITCIEPFADIPFGAHKRIAAPVQSVPLSEFESLEENDILFIDSSHVLKEASDVLFEYTEILPRLKTGVLIHIHDIFLPSPYPREWVVGDLRFWNEQYLLQSFLAFNSAFEVLWGGAWMAANHAEKLKVFPSFRDGVRPGSFWLRRK